MSRADGSRADEDRILQRLLAYDDALASGLPSAQGNRVSEARAEQIAPYCSLLNLMEQVWPRREERSTAATPTESLADPPRETPPMPFGQLGSRAGSVSSRIDAYAVGVLLYELLTGESPFVGGKRRGTISHPGIHHPGTSHRDASVDRLVAALDQFLHHAPAFSRRPSPIQCAVRWIQRNPLLAALIPSAIALATLAMLAAATFP